MDTWLEPYDEAKLDRVFCNSPGTHYPCALLHPRVASTYSNARIDDVVKVASILTKAFHGVGPSLTSGYTINLLVGILGFQWSISGG